MLGNLGSSVFGALSTQGTHSCEILATSPLIWTFLLMIWLLKVQFKGYVHLKMTHQSLFTHSHADGKQNIYGAWREKKKKKHCSILLNNWSRWGLVSKCKDTNKSEHNTAPYSLSSLIQIPKMCLKRRYLHLFYSQNIHLTSCSAKSVAWAHAPVWSGYTSATM